MDESNYFKLGESAVGSDAFLATSDKIFIGGLILLGLFALYLTATAFWDNRPWGK